MVLVLVIMTDLGMVSATHVSHCAHKTGPGEVGYYSSITRKSMPQEYT